MKKIALVLTSDRHRPITFIFTARSFQYQSEVSEQSPAVENWKDLVILRIK